MKHTIHNTNNNTLFCDIFDDDDNLIIGNYSCNIPKNTEDIDAFIVSTVYPAMVPAPVSDKQTIEASPILISMENAKEDMKWVLIAYIKENPDISLDDLLEYAESSFGWENAGLVPKMIYAYVQIAEEKQYVTLLGTTKEYYFAVLKFIILNSTNEQLAEMLS